MELFTPYQTMKESVKSIPPTSNVKLLIRHSCRPSLKGIKNPDTCGLTAAGIEVATKFGRSLPFKIGKCFSSPILRCTETIKAMTQIPFDSINISDVLGYSFVDDNNIAQKYFTEMNLKQLVFLMIRQYKVEGFITKEEGVRNILDLMFSVSGRNGYLDIYCTHDIHLAIMDSVIFSNYDSVDSIRDNWPNMLEGMWFWGDRMDFYVVWRGEVRHCKLNGIANSGYSTPFKNHNL